MSIEIEGIAPLIFVFDMPASVHFYRDVLGFELVNHAPEYAKGLFGSVLNLQFSDITDCFTGLCCVQMA